MKTKRPWLAALTLIATISCIRGITPGQASILDFVLLIIAILNAHSFVIMLQDTTE